VLVVAAVSWGIQVGFGGSAPLQGWLVAALGVALLALALNTGAALPMYWSRVSRSERRLERRREAWTSYWALYRGLVVPTCAVFGITVFVLIVLIATS
jgi:sulfite exporter TauE/SafE